MFWKFCQIYFWELVQDLPIVIAMLLIISGKEAGGRWRSAALSAAGGGLSAVLVALTERYKASFTTAIFPPPGSPLVIALVALFFSVLIYVTARYFAAGWSSKRSDVPIGIAVGAVISIFQFMILMLEGNLSALHPPRALMHTLAFMTAIPLAMLAVRKAWKSGTRGRILWTALSVLLMTTAISAIDYFPFLS